MGGVAADSQVLDKAFAFAHGLFGFPAAKRFVITEIPGGGDIFKQMVALDEEGLSFTLVYPYAFFPEYAPDIPDSDLAELGASEADQVIVMAIANVPAQFKETTANLKAPLVFNMKARTARQVILTDDYATRQRLFQAE
jgi:flagellar assembly factor FliW